MAYINQQRILHSIVGRGKAQAEGLGYYSHHVLARKEVLAQLSLFSGSSSAEQNPNSTFSEIPQIV